MFSVEPIDNEIVRPFTSFKFGQIERNDSHNFVNNSIWNPTQW